MKAGIMVILVYLAILIGAGYGWINNIVEFASCDFESPYKAEIVRGVGIPIAPVGAVLGYLDIED